MIDVSQHRLNEDGTPVQPTGTPSHTPAPTVAPLLPLLDFTDAPAAEGNWDFSDRTDSIQPSPTPWAEIYGVSIHRSTGLVSTFSAIADSIAREIDVAQRAGEASGGAGFVSLDGLLTDDEGAALDALIPTEQIAVLLSIAGFRDDVAAEFSANGQSLSGEASALLNAALLRLNAATGAERRQYESALAHPAMASSESDETPQETVSFELLVEIGESAEIERFTFCRPAGQEWVFSAFSRAILDWDARKNALPAYRARTAFLNLTD